VPCAFIETREGVTLTKDEVIDHCRKMLASFKMPKIIVFKELPKTSTGKIQKFVLREEAGSAAAIDQN
jgi:fatty-acyl-CoA synthase